MVSIQKATLEDLAAVTTLFDQYRVFYQQPADPDGARKFLHDRLENFDAEIFISYQPGKIACGFVQLYPIFSSTRMKRYWLLNDLFVREDFRGQGIAVALIDRAKMLCRDSQAAGMMLETAKSNAVGNKLYPRAGFLLDTEHNFYTWSAD
jgi:GNAT superfamily N-acetyltransferase